MAEQTSVKICFVLPCYYPTTEQVEAAVQFSIAVRQKCREHFGALCDVLFVEDGSQSKLLNEQLLSAQQITLLRLETNQGKGAAIKRGIQWCVQHNDLHANATVYGFLDFDLPYSLDDVVTVLGAVVKGADVAIADRSLSKTSASSRLSRQFIHRVFRFVIRVLIAGGVHDTQAGLKAFDARFLPEIARLSQLNRFLFDLEFVYIALAHKLCVRSVPVGVVESHQSATLRTMLRSNLFAELFTLIVGILQRRYFSGVLVDQLVAKISLPAHPNHSNHLVNTQ